MPVIKSIFLTIALALAPAVALAQTPTGEGDPAATSCKPPQHLPNSNFSGPKICKTNAEWARYHRDGMDVSADGTHDEKAHGANRQP